MTHECGRCGNVDREPRVRMSLVNLEREARHDGRPYEGPPYGQEYRCADREACTRRVRGAA